MVDFIMNLLLIEWNIFSRKFIIKSCVVIVKKDFWNWMLSNFIEVSLQTLFYYVINKYNK